MIKRIDSQNLLLRLVLRGYKSIAECNVELGMLNILIGANGAGKSNFISFFRLIKNILDRQLQLAIGSAGGPDALLHFGRKKTEALQATLHFGDSTYAFILEPTEDNRMVFAKEDGAWGTWKSSGSGHFETSYYNEGQNLSLGDWGVLIGLRSLRLYHFHDTSQSAWVKQIHGINDNQYLRDDARNLAAFLYRLKLHHEEHYQRIVRTVKLVAPFFGDFLLRPTVGNAEKIQLEWTEDGHDTPFTASALSDGTLRFICLATVLLQPQDFMPAAILIDEPELGLHPFAISVLAGLMKSAANDHQLIVSTQSVELVNEFDAEDLIVVDKHGGASTFRRPDAAALEEWLADYSLGELWKKNLLGGRPTR
jgi:predicted ATPase